MVLARRAAIARTGVKLADMPARAAQRRRYVLLFDVHVKSVEQQADVGPVDIPDHPQPLIDGVDQIRLEPIERLDASVTPW